MAEFITRYPPCPIYEIRRFENWLEDMAKDGWILLQNPFSRLGSVGFRKAEPKSIRYRVQPAPKKPGWFSRHDGPQIAVDLAADCGWTYLGMRDGFLVYFTDDPDAPELNTDLQVQLLALEAHRKRRWTHLLSGIVMVFLFIALLLWVGPVSFCMNKPNWYLPLIFLCYFYAIVLQIKELLHLKRQQQKLADGEYDSTQTSFPFHKLTILVTTGLWIFVMCSIVITGFFSWQTFRWQPVSKYPGPLPFATIEDVTGETLDTTLWSADHNNDFAARTALLANKQILFEQYGHISCDNEDPISIALEIEYYEMRSEWLATQLFREIHRTAARSKGEYRQYIEQQTPELPVDQAAAYSVYQTTLLLRQGNQVLLVRFIPSYEINNVYFERWAPTFAASILD